MLLSDIQFASAAAIILSGQAVKAEATSPCFTTLAVKCFLAPLELIFHSRTTQISPIFVFGCQSVDLCELRFTFFFFYYYYYYYSSHNQRELIGASVFHLVAKWGGAFYRKLEGRNKTGIDECFWYIVTVSEWILWASGSWNLLQLIERLVSLQFK